MGPVHNANMAAGVMKFGDSLELDRITYELRRSGRPLKLERIPMEILFLLVERRGQLVSREDIIGRVWGKDVFLDTDNSINSAIRKIRQSLKDDPERPLFIQTVTGKGNRFIADVTEVHVAPASAVALGEAGAKASPVEPALVTLPPSARSSRSRKGLVSVAVLILLLAAGISAFRIWVRPRPALAPHRAMLAVLPFANLSNDPQQEYFSDGLTEEITTDLSQLNPEQLGVIARTSATAYKHTDKTITQIGRELGVDYVLEGSVRREGGAGRISAQLIRVSDQAHLWAHTYEREAGGLLALQNELGRAIAQQVQVKLAPPYGNRSPGKYSANPEAYELYLKGRFYLAKRTWPEITESAEYFQRSIEKDPGFALAYAGLADSYLADSIRAPQESEPRAKAAAARALELDDNLAEAHTVLGSVKTELEYDWPGAEQEFKRAIELNPNNADAHYRYAWDYLTPLGKSGEAIAEMKKALKLDPFSRIDNTVLGCVYFYAREYDQAEEQFNRAIKLNPDFFVTYYHVAWLYSQLGQYQNAIAALTQGRLLAGDDRAKTAAPDEVALRKAILAEGPAGFWRQMKIQQKDDSEIGEFGMPQVNARLGEKQEALQGLERNYQERSTLGSLLNVDPAFDSLRSDPRFEQLVSRMGLTPNIKSE
jgi:TolB-like protein/DNA-binding winged helix-turn-helix (wHTH) protein